jgi:glyceraldehyde 3-phosphate dehydrogenase
MYDMFGMNYFLQKENQGMEKAHVTKVFINGFGRIGRLVARRILKLGAKSGIEIVGINNSENAEILAYLLAHDSTHGNLQQGLRVLSDGADKVIQVTGHFPWRVYSQRNIERLPFQGVDVAVESTGKFTKRKDLEKYIRVGVGHVILTAPAKGAEDIDFTVVLGVNEDRLNVGQHRIISNASCTTNCLAPVVQVLQENFGVRQGMMNTVHAYTNDQKLQDVAHKDLRRARAAPINIIPTSTGAARAIGLVLPELAGRLDGMALRVPVEDGSCIYLVAELEREVTQEELVDAFEGASNTARYNSLTLSRDKLVSRDIIGTEHSAIVDAEYLKVLGGRGRMVQVLAWYDNEWAYACRVVDLIRYIAQQKMFEEAR